RRDSRGTPPRASLSPQQARRQAKDEPFSNQEKVRPQHARHRTQKSHSTAKLNGIGANRGVYHFGWVALRRPILFHHLNKSREQIMAILRAGRGFGVVLH